MQKLKKDNFPVFNKLHVSSQEVTQSTSIIQNIYLWICFQYKSEMIENEIWRDMSPKSINNSSRLKEIKIRRGIAKILSVIPLYANFKNLLRKYQTKCMQLIRVQMKFICKNIYWLEQINKKNIKYIFIAKNERRLNLKISPHIGYTFTSVNMS